MEKIYADAFGIIGGLSDIKIDFVTVDLMLDADGKPIGETRNIEQRVTMPMPLAKDFAKKLTEAVEHYENTFGPVLDLEEVRRKNEQGQ